MNDVAAITYLDNYGLLQYLYAPHLEVDINGNVVKILGKYK